MKTLDLNAAAMPSKSQIEIEMKAIAEQREALANRARELEKQYQNVCDHKFTPSPIAGDPSTCHKCKLQILECDYAVCRKTCKSCEHLFK